MIGKKNILVGFIIICLIISPIITPSSATDWPMFQLNTKHTGYMDEASDFNPDTWIIQTGGILTSPVISDKIIYFGSNNGLFSAHNIEQGTKVWDYKTEANITASPVVVGDYVYFGSGDSYLYALNKKTGEDIWKYKTGNSIETTPAIDNGIIYFGSDDQRLYALNTNDSSMKWEFQTGNAIRSSPTIFNNIIYFGSDDGKIYAVNINGEKVWEYNTGSVVRSSAAINNTTLYIGTDNGNFYALNTVDGSVLWSYDFDGSIKSSALLDTDGSSLFIGSDNGNITALDMRNGKLKWSVKTGNIESTPALMEDNIVVTSTSGTVYVLNKYSGKEEWSFIPGYYLFNSQLSSPIIYGDDILTGDANGNMYSLDFSRKTGPVTPYLYYIIGLGIAIIGILLIVRIHRKRRNKGE